MNKINERIAFDHFGNQNQRELERERHNYVTDFEIPISNRHHRTQYSRFKSNSNKRKMIDTFDGISMTCESNKIDMPLKNSTAQEAYLHEICDSYAFSIRI